MILRPAVIKRYLELSEPDMEDQLSDLERVRAAIDDFDLQVDLDVVRTLGKTLRDAHWKVTAVIVDDRLIDVEPGDTTERRHAIAFDLGTTTVVATLLDLSSARPLAVRSMLNKQQPYGADVISRISATMMDDTALATLQRLAHETLDQLAQEVCEAADVRPDEVYEITLAGNQTMTQLALGIDPEPLSMAPFIIASRSLPPATALDFGVQVHKRAPGRDLPGARRLRGRRHRRRPARDRADARPPDPAVHRRRHQLRDRDGLRRARRRHRGAGRPGLRGRLDPLRHARRRGRDRERQDHRRRAHARRDRRRRARSACAARASSTPCRSWCGSG